MVGSRSKFLLLMWKNWKLQIRHPIQTAFEILVPVLFCIILVIVRSLIESTVEEPIKFNAFQPNRLCLKLYKTNLAFSPQPEFIEALMQQVVIYIETNNQIRGFDNASSLEQYLIPLPEPHRGIGIVFPDEYANRNSFPPKVDFTLRFPSETNRDNTYAPDVKTWQTNLLYPRFQEPGPRYRWAEVASPNYLNECFLSLQSAISRAIIEHVHPKMVDAWPKITMQRFPYPSFIYDILIVILKSMIALIIVLAFEYTAISIIKVITAEKEKQLKESMKIMGLSGTLHWAAWFAKSLLFMLISIIIMVVLLKVDGWYDEHIPAVLPKCDGFLLFLFLLVYSITVITLCFAISVFFTRANMAAGIGGSIFFLFVLPASILEMRYEEIGLSTKLSVSLMSNTALSYGFRLICMFESTGEGLQWDNLFRPVTTDDDLTMAHIFLMMIIDAILYMCVALYVEAIYPGPFGVGKPWHFIFTMWFRKPMETISRHRSIREPHNFEAEPNGYAGIDIQGLTKCYGDKVAVDDMQLRMYEDQITVLLGHNGAGKTTTLSMLTGMETPSGGTATINRFDLRNDMEQVRSSLGLCPQHNILFDELTVTEHIYFFSRLKGADTSKIEEEIEKFLHLLQITDKRNAQSSTLSGGMKRKLAVAVAFCGDSKVVMLDEPTAGMDPGARRALWGLVESQKPGRTIMLTTHFMDEADLLGDRIAIMAGGQLQCCGSSYFLKKRYGAGYHLVMEKLPHCNVDQVTRTIQQHLPHIQVESNIGSELSYSLNENDRVHFEEMLGNVESRMSHLGIGSYGISLTTLEEVFMKVGASDSSHFHQSNGDQSQSEVISVKIEPHLKPSLTGARLLVNQILAMILKRVLSTVRSWPLFLAQILIPVIMLIIAVIAGRQTSAKELPNRVIQLDDYNNPVTLLKSIDPTNRFYASANQWLSSNGFQSERVDDVESYILAKTAKVPGLVRMSYIIAAEFSSDHIHGWFNNDPFHSPPLLLNFIYNSISRNIIDGPMLEITVNNHPLPHTVTSKLKQLQQGNNIGFQLAINLGFCTAFISAFYILFYIRERVCKVKHLQFVSGVNIAIFWGLSYVWDWMTYLVTIACLIVVLLCFQEDGFKSAQDIGNLFLIFTYFGFAMLPLIYLLSFFYKLPATGFTRVILFATLFGVFAFIIVEILSAEALDLQDIGKALDWVFLFIPHYDLSSAIRARNLEYQRYQACSKIVQICIGLCTKLGVPSIECEDTCWKKIQVTLKDCRERREQYYIWKKPGILRNIVFAFSVGVALIIILLLLEFKVFHYIYYKLQPPQPPQTEEELDDDVSFEKKKISLLSREEIAQHNLVLRGMRKFYKNFQAVKGLNLSVNQYECFGLLGVNGAGKTTSFRMITGDTSISSGDVFVKGLNLKTQIKDVYKRIGKNVKCTFFSVKAIFSFNTGYCPQFDALFDDLTGRETIMVFALLRGYTRSECNFIAEKFAHDFDFYPHLEKKVREMSGGNKRKLSTAVAFIGDPPIVYLDEPSTGMDPATKRHLWNTLCRIRDDGKCLILTTHSMEECEALCTRLAIMVNGQFKCLGSTQHLKNKFARGFTLTIKIKKHIHCRENIIRVAEFVIREFPTAVLREHHQEMITYYISDSGLPWSKMFGVIERAKHDLQIEDYFLGQSSLEHVFLKFTQLEN